MFTGIIQQVCTVKALSKSGDSAALTVDLGQLANESKIGDSIAINGVCLTVIKLAGILVTFDVSSETLAKSTIGKLTPGSKVNIELALRADDRFGGHFVLGHVDGSAIIKKIEKKTDFATFTFTAPKDLLDQMITKGSVAIDGISLTIAELNPDGFTVAVIPQTLKETSLGQAKITAQVNIEIDIITKTVRKYLQQLSPGKTGLTLEDLRQQGF
ncbi:MAG: riboflavin synthase [Sedimentisphaerales bacterium]|jgi:riboflavin synthase